MNDISECRLALDMLDRNHATFTDGMYEVYIPRSEWENGRPNEIKVSIKFLED